MKKIRVASKNVFDPAPSTFSNATRYGTFVFGEPFAHFPIEVNLRGLAGVFACLLGLWRTCYPPAACRFSKGPSVFP
jgi:hypothetical protein